MNSLGEESELVRQELHLNFYYASQDQVELKRELVRIKDLHSMGFIQTVEYETRKQEIETYLKSNVGTSSRKKGRRKERAIRLFLSSTFRDMQTERDELVKHTFPELKQMCAARGIFFSEIDLRFRSITFF